MLAGEHRIATSLQVDGPGQIGEQRQGFAVEPVLAVVDVQVADRQGVFAAPVGLGVEELPQVGGTDLLVVLDQRGPGGHLCDLGNHDPDPSE